ncbi:hypothetical protein IFM89_017492 [Coptis chinensis]|uniref:DUF4283 domain-containing protein n=1 Tax=Coptis chinensis TaxID=261450 RepID=A0A835HY54_9MAGN|nr:hypothetical protein IFM89_017492 [Coptis chinensis]
MDLPKELWTDERLWFVASLISEPLNMDEATRARTQLSFAKICVVVPVDYSFKTSIPVKMGEKVIDLQLEYPWIPVSCSNCKLYGHKANSCPAKPKQVWRVKDNLNTKEKVTETINEEVAFEEDTSTEEGSHYAECDENSSLDSLNTESCHTIAIIPDSTHASVYKEQFLHRKTPTIGVPTIVKEVSQTSAAIKVIDFLRDFYDYEVVDYNYNEVMQTRHQNEILQLDIKEMQHFCRMWEEEVNHLNNEIRLLKASNKAQKDH